MADIKPLKLTSDGHVARFSQGDVVAVENGGTGVTTTTDLTTLLFPPQAGQSDKVLTTDGSGNLSWVPQNNGITVSTIASTDLQTIGGIRTNVNTLRFDTDAGFDLIDLGDGTVKVGMNSTFKFIVVDGEEMLTAHGLDTLELIAGTNVSLVTDNLSNPQSITINATSGGSSVSVGLTPPATPSAGDMWWNSESGTLKIYYNDGDTSQWVDATPSGQPGPTGYTGSAGTAVPKVVFRAGRTTSQSVTSGVWTTVVGDVERFDTASAYNTSTGVFTAPHSGYYQFNGAIMVGGTTLTQVGLSITNQTSGEMLIGGYDVYPSSGANERATASGILRVLAGETVVMSGYAVATTGAVFFSDAGMPTRFDGHLIDLV